MGEMGGVMQAPKTQGWAYWEVSPSISSPLSRGDLQPSVIALIPRPAVLEEAAASQQRSDTRLPARIPRRLIFGLDKQFSLGLPLLRTCITYFSGKQGVGQSGI